MTKSLKTLITFTCLVVHIYFHVSTAEAQTYTNWSDASAVPMSAHPTEGDTYYAQVVQRRRVLYWKTIEDYISYGALSANRVMCPPRSGRSYYTHDCLFARGPAHPYSRGCSSITRCRR
ncbi:hypothetical protein vseg_005201 [Gypsophila vaccaria]